MAAFIKQTTGSCRNAFARLCQLRHETTSYHRDYEYTPPTPQATLSIYLCLWVSAVLLHLVSPCRSTRVLLRRHHVTSNSILILATNGMRYTSAQAAFPKANRIALSSQSSVSSSQTSASGSRLGVSSSICRLIAIIDDHHPTRGNFAVLHPMSAEDLLCRDCGGALVPRSCPMSCLANCLTETRTGGLYYLEWTIKTL